MTTMFDSNATLPFEGNFTDSINNTILTTCRQVNEIIANDRCAYVQRTPDCIPGIGYFNYTEYMYCLLGPQGVTSMVSISVLWLLILFAGLGVTANDFLCPSLFIISKSLKMSQNVAGVTLLAFGNGSPDIFSAIAGIQQKKTEMVIGGLIGGGIFVTTVVAGSIFLTQSFTMMKRPFLRDVTFYLIAGGWAFYLFHSGQITIYHAIGFVGLYVLYIVVVVASRFIHQKTLEYSEKAREAAESAECGLTFKGGRGDEYDDPEAFGITLTAFFKYRWDEDRRRNSREHYCYDNEVFAISLPPLPEDDVPPPAYVRRRSCKGSHGKGEPCNSEFDPCPEYEETSAKYASCEKCDVSSKEEKCEKLPLPEDVNQWTDFLDKILPINRQEWPTQRWWERALDIFKSPILFILLITTPVIDYKMPRNNWCRVLNSLQCITGPLFVIFAIAPTYKIGGVFPLYALVLILCGVLAGAVYFTTKTNEIPRFHTAFAYLGFGVAVTWIYCIANEIVVLLQAVGIVFNLSDSILGLTILAWGNCLLDFLSNLAVARKGFPRMGIAACFGAPFLTLLLGVGVPSILQLVGPDGPIMHLVYSRLTTILFSTLAVSLLSTLVAMSIFRFEVKRHYGIYLICLYLTFLIVAVLTESSVF